jgi:glycosyltransferase involved in cell wall biosynthesis
MKRVLIVSHCFPPVTNMGSHRIRRFVRHLPEFGWEPVVLTAPGAQETPGAEIHRVASVDLTALWRKFKRSPSGDGSGRTMTTSLNRWVMIPDKYFPWIKPAARAGAALKNIDAIYSTSDPLSDHLVALRISRETGVPFVAEFRDLWLGNPYFARAHPTPLHRALHARLERRVVAGASAIVGLSRGIAGYFERHYVKPARVIYNCFDPEEYGPAAPPAGGFTVVYAGALYSSRSPEPFLAGFAQFVKQHSDARFVIVGGSPDLDLPAMVQRHGLTGHVELTGRVSHGEALRRMQAASVLLAVQSPDDDVHVPGKIFEYLGAGRPVLAVSRPGEVAELIAEHKLGWVAEPNAESVAAKLAEAYRDPSLAARARERFSVREATRELAAVLDEVAGAR